MRGCFAVRAGLLAAILTIALLVYGINEIMQAARFSQPKVMTFEQFVQQKPDAGWYRVTGGLCDLTRGIRFHQEYEKDDVSHVTEVYVPVFSISELKSGARLSTRLIVQTRDPVLLENYRSFTDSAKSMTKEQAEEYMRRHGEQLFVRKDIEGMVKAGLNSEESDVTKELARLSTNMDPNYIILEEGKKPSMLLGLGLTALGALLAVGQVLYYLARVGGRITGSAGRI